MRDIFVLLLALYIMTAGFGILVRGTRGFGWANRLWKKAITVFIGWFFDQVGELLKHIGRRIRH